MSGLCGDDRTPHRYPDPDVSLVVSEHGAGWLHGPRGARCCRLLAGGRSLGGSRSQITNSSSSQAQTYNVYSTHIAF